MPGSSCLARHHTERTSLITRAEITRRLITARGFNALAVDAYRVNRYVQDTDDDQTGQEALAGFRRFPIWMWRNTDVLAFIEWLRTYNSARMKYHEEAGFYGLDLYSLYASAEAVITYLQQVDPEAGQRAGYRYACFEHFHNAF